MFALAIARLLRIDGMPSRTEIIDGFHLKVGRAVLAIFRNPDKAVIMTDNGDTMGVNTWKAEQAALAKATPSVKPSHSVQAKATQSVQAKQISEEECFELLNKPSACQRA